MQITITTNIAQVQAELGKAKRQVPFAAAKALTQTGAKVKAAMPAALDKALDRPTAFTKNGTFIEKATPAELVATVGFKPIQAKYLKYQHDGGSRAPNNKAQRLPSAIGLDEHGNLPRGIISQLLSVARRESKLTKRKAIRIRVSKKLDIFYGDPKDVGGHNFPPGIYKIVSNGLRSQLIPLIVFPAISVSYRKRFDMAEIAMPIVEREFPALFKQALSDAIATAK